MQRKIGLTGGIATGKTAVSDYLSRKYQYPIFDADIYAREAVTLGSPISNKIFQRYDDRLQQEDGNLDRKALGQIVFNNPEEKRWLEEQIHPFVRQRFAEELAQCNSAIVVCVIPLLIEANLVDMVSEVWVVSCTPTQQLQRLQTRNNLTEAEAIARIESQMPLAEKIKVADVVFDNSSDLATLYHQVDQAIQGCC